MSIEKTHISGSIQAVIKKKKKKTLQQFIKVLHEMQVKLCTFGVCFNQPDLPEAVQDKAVAFFPENC